MTTTKTAKTTTNNQRAALEALRREVVAVAGRSSDVEAIEERFYGLPGFTFSARYLGNWQNPEDMLDDEDCDHQIPTPSTVARLDKLVATVAQRFPGVRLTWSNQEKCWVSFDAE